MAEKLMEYPSVKRVMQSAESANLPGTRALPSLFAGPQLEETSRAGGLRRTRRRDVSGKHQQVVIFNHMPLFSSGIIPGGG